MTTDLTLADPPIKLRRRKRRASLPNPQLTARVYELYTQGLDPREIVLHFEGHVPTYRVRNIVRYGIRKGAITPHNTNTRIVPLAVHYQIHFANDVLNNRIRAEASRLRSQPSFLLRTLIQTIFDHDLVDEILRKGKSP